MRSCCRQIHEQRRCGNTLQPNSLTITSRQKKGGTGAWVIAQSSMIVLKGAHVEVRNMHELCRELRPGAGAGTHTIFRSFAQLLNFMIFNGYECLSSNPVDCQNAGRVLMRIRVPRAFLQANPTALS
ncbi:unnamed protein product [Symbiodinium sp. CCMP2456]|nr:unnamed protein product [Symbiodinium sp. CCMP2456]